MAAARTVVSGIVKGGVVVPEAGAKLPEGAQVEIVITLAGIPAELRAEFEAWERVSDEAWAMIEQWEREEPA
jgi:SH3-like domain-containing protein